MKRSLAALLCLASMVGVASLCFGQTQVAAHWTVQQLRFRTTDLYATLSGRDPGAAKRYSGTIGYIDSVAISRVGSGSAVAETTTAISTAGWGRPPILFSAGSDSVVVMRLIIQNTANVASTEDSAYVEPQVSVDGSNWQCANLVKDVNNSTCNPTAAASLAVSTMPMLLVGPATTPKTGSLVFHDLASGEMSIDIKSISTWPYIRFVIVRDVSNALVLSPQSAYLGHWSASVLENQ